MAVLPLFNHVLNRTPANAHLSDNRSRHFVTGLLLIISDYLGILIIPALGCFFTFAHGNLQKNVLFWNLLAAITVLLVTSHGGYRESAFFNLNQNIELAFKCYIATAVTMLLAALLLGHLHAVSRYWTTAELCCTPVFLAVSRIALTNEIMRSSRDTAPAGPVIVCYNRLPDGLVKALAEQRISSAVSGVLFLSDQCSGAERSAWPVIPSISGLLEAVQRKDIQDVIFVHQPEMEDVLAAGRNDLLSELLSYSARIWLAFDLQPRLPYMLASKFGHCKLIPIVDDNLINSLNLTKRFFDLAIGAILLVVTSPFLLIISVLVRASGPGPVVFRQMRTGAHGQFFPVLKFRTMQHVAGSAFRQATENDSRVTWIGHYLRRSSLDELLQLINVLQGDMSLVGPRPHAPETQVQGMTFEDAVKMYRIRHRVKPGITGLAQIRGQRGETPALANLEQRLSSDLEYIETWSVWLDISILLRTFTAMIFMKNAC